MQPKGIEQKAGHRLGQQPTEMNLLPSGKMLPPTLTLNTFDACQSFSLVKATEGRCSPGRWRDGAGCEERDSVRERASPLALTTRNREDR